MTLKAMVLCAGLGTRLRPLTLVRPKPLLPVLNRPILYHTLDFLERSSVFDVVVNVHYMSEYFTEYLTKKPHQAIMPVISYEEKILGTGGGLKKAEWFFDDTFLVINGDTLFSVCLDDAISFHREKGALATLVLVESTYAPRVAMNEFSQIIAISDTNKAGLFTYSGIQILECEIFEHIGANCFVNIMDVLRSLIRSGCREIYGFVADFKRWKDVGRVEDYSMCNRDLLLDRADITICGDLKGPSFLVSGTARLEEGITVKDWAIVGPGCKVGRGSELIRSILWEDVDVDGGASIVDSILTDHIKVAGRVHSAMLTAFP